MAREFVKFNDGKHIATIIGRTPCPVHPAKVGEACWNVYPDSKPGTTASAVCGRRIKSHGYDGKISQTAMQLKRTQSPVPYKKKEVHA